jgi:type II restriction enzyme ngoMIV (fragment)
MKSLLAREREKYHKLLLENSALTIDNNGVPSNADKSSKLSISIATRIATSAKWTMRSDRAQNSRTEALGLIRNRKGNLPHIAVVTGEPLPGRLASLALGTGDIDCMYHFALYELIDAVNATGAEDSIELLDVLIKGKRLKDISDLPLDLAV